MEESEKREDREVFFDTLFRQKRKKGRLREVDAPKLEVAVADTHAHTHLLADPGLALARCAAHGVSFVCNVLDIYEDDPGVFSSFDAFDSRARELLAVIAGAAPGLETPHVRTIVGCHPHNAKHYSPALEERLIERLCDPRVCAVGEIGLDYHYDFSPREDQRNAFRRQIRLAKAYHLPVSLHLRDAHDEAFSILQEEGFPKEGTLLHCCSLSWDALKPWVDAGCFIAYGGALTFKASEAAREACRKVPLDRLLSETDAPYMAPEPLRGMTCEPAYVIFTTACMAGLHGADSPEARKVFLDQLMGNARALLDCKRFSDAP